MKQCSRCGQQLNDNEQFCTRCGGTNFKTMGNNNQNMDKQRQQNQGQQRPVGNNIGQQQQRPNRPNSANSANRPNNAGQGQNQQQQRPMSQQQQRPNRPGQVNNPQQNYSSQQYVQQHTQQEDDTNTVLKPRKLRGKEKKQMELDLAYAMKAAQERGEYFDIETYKRTHNWYEEVGAGGNNKPQQSNSNEMTVVNWLVTLLLMWIPVANIIIAVINITKADNQEYKKNYFKAFLIYYVVALVLSTIIAFLV